jgi:hypothetical protein
MQEQCIFPKVCSDLSNPALNFMSEILIYYLPLNYDSVLHSGGKTQQYALFHLDQSCDSSVGIVLGYGLDY